MCWPRTVPTCVSYDPAYVYEMAVIMQDGMRRMYEEGEDRLLLHHHVQRGLRHAGDAGGRRRKALCAASTSCKPAAKGKATAQLFGSGPILNEVLRAQEILAEKYGVAGRCVERDQLQRAAARRAGGGALEPPASGGDGEDALYPECAAATRRDRSSRPATT